MSFELDSRNKNVVFDYNSTKFIGPVTLQNAITILGSLTLTGLLNCVNIQASGNIVCSGQVSTNFLLSGPATISGPLITTGGSGNIIASGNLQINGVNNATSYATQGIYTGMQNSGSASANIDLVGVTGQEIAFMTTGTSTPIATISVATSAGNMSIEMGNTPAVNISVSGVTTFNNNQIVINTGNTPASSSAAGVQGTICWDTSFIYVCVATNTWKRIAISTW